jgi:thioredoxin 1
MASGAADLRSSDNTLPQESQKINVMAFADHYTADAPARSEIDHLPGPVVVEFGSPACGHCRAAQHPMAAAFAGHAGVRHFKIEDGPGRPLGRSFGVKLWPTLVFMRDGREVDRLVRPRESAPIAAALAGIDTPA